MVTTAYMTESRSTDLALHVRVSHDLKRATQINDLKNDNQSNRHGGRLLRCCYAVLGSIGLLVFSVSCVTPGWLVGKKHQAIEATPWLEDGFVGRRMVTEHFELLSTLVDREFESALPLYVETLYSQYADSIASAATSNQPRMRMYLFGNRQDWQRFVRQAYPTEHPVVANIHNGGFSDRNMSASFYRDRSSFLATMAHEGWHQYVASRIRFQMPAWLNEGLACYYESVSMVNGKPVVASKRNTFRIGALRKAIRRNKLQSLEQLVQTRAYDVLRVGDPDQIQTYYAQVWALVTWLQHGAGSKRTAAFARVLRDISDQTIGARLSAAKLLEANSQHLSTTALIFSIYFSQAPHDMQGAYEDYLIQLVGY